MKMKMGKLFPARNAHESTATALGASLAAYIQGWAAANNVQLKPIRGVLLGLARELASNPALTNVDYSEVQATNEKKRLMFNGGDCLSLTNLRLQRCLGVRRVLMDTGPACTTRNRKRGLCEDEGEETPSQSTDLELFPGRLHFPARQPTRRRQVC